MNKTTKAQNSERGRGVKGVTMSTPMVKALLDGRKTVMRRAMNPQPNEVIPFGFRGIVYEGNPWHPDAFKGTPAEGLDLGRQPEKCWQVEDGAGNIVATYSYPSPCLPGETVYVREAGSAAHRVRLHITGVTVERLHDITAADAIAEGLEQVEHDKPFGPLWDCGELEMGGYGATTDPVEAYEHLWNRLNADLGYPWKKNPWVWRIEFEVPVGEVPA